MEREIGNRRLSRSHRLMLGARADLRDGIYSIAETTQLVQAPEIWRATYETDI